MRYAQFFVMSTGYVPDSIPPRFNAANVVPIEACGSDGVHILDGRYGLARCANVARAECKRRGFAGFTIMQGETFSRSRCLRELEVSP
jgi:hypothetical protein